MNAHRIVLRAIFFFAVLCCTTHLSTAQTEFTCGMTGTGSTTATQRGGQWMSARDTVNALIVFVQFPDDRYDTSYSRWPTQPLAHIYTPPDFINTYIDSLPSQMSSSGNLTHYFRDMSFGRFTLIGKTRFVVTPHTRQWYLDNGWHRWHINREVIQTLDASLDFAQFDLWKRYDEYDIRREADGRVDEVFMIYRNLSSEYPRSPIDSLKLIYDLMQFHGGESSLGYEWENGNPAEFFVDNGQRRIGSGHPAVYSGYPGMGTTSVIGGAGDGWFGLVPYRVQIHEFSHHFMSNGDDYGHCGAGFWAMLNDYRFRFNAASTSCPNSFEREVVGWHYPDSIGTTGGSWYNLTLSDYVTQNESYKIKIPGSSPDEYFRLENHQRISQWDTPEMLDATAKGLYVIHQTSPNNPKLDLRLAPADGRWSWTVTEAVYPSWYPSGLPVFKKTGVDRVNGYNDSWEVPYSWTPPPYMPNPLEVIFWRDRATNQLIERPLIRGDGNDAFRLGKDIVFSPWSNPNSQNIAKEKTWIAIEIVNESNGTIIFNLHIDSTNCLLTSPSKPQDLQISVVDVDDAMYPHLMWASVEEPDVLSGGNILVERRFKPSDQRWLAWEQVVALGGGETEWTDMSTEYRLPDVGEIMQYRIRTIDAQELTSLYSDIVSLGGDFKYKLGVEVQSESPSSYALFPCFPNPFNPTTTFKFQIPEDGNVSLKICNTLGQEVATLLDEYRTAGLYSHTFDASSLATGVYIYTLRSGGFTASKKFLLLK